MIERILARPAAVPAATARQTGRVGRTTLRNTGRISTIGLPGDRRPDRRVRAIVTPPVEPLPVEGTFDPQVMAAEVRARLREITMCTARVARRLPVVTGKLVVRWTVQTDGSVSEVETVNANVDAEVAQCVQTLVARWRFTPPDTAAIKVSFPFVFQ